MTTPAMAAWSLRADQMRRTADQTPATAWRTRGRGAQWRDITAMPRLAVTYSDWSWPIYQAAAATPVVRVFRSPAHWDQDGYYTTAASPTRTSPAVIRWAPGWRTATGEDAGVMVDYLDSGVEALAMRPASPFDRFLIDWALLVAGSPVRTRDGDMIVDALAVRTPDNVGRYRGRGSGAVPKRTGVVTAGEVRSGDIGHPLAVTGLTQWGPGATIGVHATVVEHPVTAPAGYPTALRPGANPDVVPAGTRLVLPMSDADIAAWVARRHHTGARATTAATFVRALRDWGMVVGAETGVGDPQIETTGVRGPDAAAWAALGIDSATTAATLLDGLPWDRITALT